MHPSGFAYLPRRPTPSHHYRLINEYVCIKWQRACTQDPARNEERGMKHRVPGGLERREGRLKGLRAAGDEDEMCMLVREGFTLSQRGLVMAVAVTSGAVKM